jgi:hypothetical protein
MKRPSVLRLLPFAFCLLPFAFSAPAHAQPPSQSQSDEGKAHFTRGVALYKEGDFRAALVEFTRAYELTHAFKVLYNIGQTEFELQDYAGALRSFQKYVADGGAEIDAGRRAQVEEDLKKLAGRVARLEIKTNVEGADVLIDDVVVGKTPLKEPVLVSMGRRKVTLQKGALPPSARYVDLAGGDKSQVVMELAEQKAAPPGTEPVGPAPAPPPSRTGVWVGLAATGALAVGAVVTGVLALGAHSDAVAKLGMKGGIKATDVEAAHSKTATLALVTDILGGAAIAAGGVTLIVGLTGGKSSPEQKTVSVRVGPRGVLLGGRF